MASLRERLELRRAARDAELGADGSGGSGGSEASDASDDDQEAAEAAAAEAEAASPRTGMTTPARTPARCACAAVACIALRD
jgi:hypothetical protein